MRLFRLPMLPLCLAFLAVAMLGPAGYAVIELDWQSARIFLYCAVFTGFASATLAMALTTGPRDGGWSSELRNLVVCWLVVPVFAGAPLWLRTPFIGHWGAWFEMVAAFTTTGGTVYAEPDKVPGAIHMWRGIVAWLGGLVTLVAAFAILAPRNLGGFEVAIHMRPGRRRVGEQASGEADIQGVSTIGLHGAAAMPLDQRLARVLRMVLPVYTTLTAVLAFLFSSTGQSSLASVVHAMAIVSTSGISPHAHGLAAEPNFVAELMAAGFMVLAATRLTYTDMLRAGALGRWLRDPELRLMALLVATASLALLLRHWFGALTIDLGGRASEALPAVWGAVFTSLSFITTTGFESASWHSARDWSGLANPGLILLGLCSVGGGAATTAGGIKLVRFYALVRHGHRELERIAQPSSVLATGARLRGILREGAFLAWAFIMLYTMAVFFTLIALTVTGLPFEHSLIGALSAISNTGPAFSLVTEGAADFGRLGESQKAILAVAMVLGRIEALAVISLFGADTWDRFSIRTKKTGNVRNKSADSKW
jgi:trk system potassium uptake protein TrkH